MTIDATGLLNTILEASKSANPDQDKCNLLFATVLSTNPIKIRINDGGLEITSSFIVQSPFCFTKTITIPNHTHNVPSHKTQEAKAGSSPPTVGVTIKENGQTSSTITAEAKVTAAEESGHSHEVSSFSSGQAGYYQFDVWKGLAVNDKVVVIRANGGQMYFIICKAG